MTTNDLNQWLRSTFAAKVQQSTSCKAGGSPDEGALRAYCNCADQLLAELGAKYLAVEIGGAISRLRAAGRDDDANKLELQLSTGSPVEVLSVRRFREVGREAEACALEERLAKWNIVDVYRRARLLLKD
jgi:hypothetical protein